MLSVAKFIGMSTKDINIVVDHHYMSKVYTCGSIVSGQVEINPRTDIPFSFSSKKTRNLRKGEHTGSSGYVTAETAQTGAVRLSVDGHRASSSSAQIQFTFAPLLAKMPPPRITGKSVKGFPQPKSILPNLGSGRESFVLCTRVIVDSVSSTPWIEHVTLPVQSTPRRSRNTVSSVTQKNYNLALNLLYPSFYIPRKYTKTLL
ncbi:uncharacterized protein LY79DRAFT_580465 [Colletotrichum navitas]|uniref:Arrestin n=1 Tax=Colletotrichum navitas TaxID=681940 RepID=A0AAD8V538_9PEZI|nr:uncharacterized protein LY79DRAFT_580465 [Colletotrichum navitas]KAK1589848.1 hypothetical protein LY79DRAFT_580465 [Colletotrichum navitas]